MKKLSKQKAIGISCVTIAIIVMIVLGVVLNNSNKIQEIEENPINSIDAEENIDYGNTLQKLSTVVELDNSINAIDNITREQNLYGGITRFQGVMLAYNTLLELDKLPSVVQYELIYSDLADIPTRYIIPIKTVNSIGLLIQQDKFSGYSFLTPEELECLIDGLVEYIVNYKEDDKDINDTDGQNDSDIIGSINNTDNEILDRPISTRSGIDHLNGTSVAVNENPTTIGELKENIEQIQELNFESDRLQKKYETGDDIIEFDYINPEEGIANLNAVSDATDGNISGDRLTALTVISPVNFGVELRENSMIVLSSDILRTKDKLIFGLSLGAVGIKDNEIVSSGMFAWDSDTDFCMIVMDDIEIDTIGFIVDKVETENRTSLMSYEYYSSGNVTYTLMLVPLSQGTITSLWG